MTNRNSSTKPATASSTQSSANANAITTESIMTTQDTTNSNSNATVTPSPAISPEDVVFVQPPPPNANIPPQPPGFVPVKGGFGRSIKPKKTEAMAMPDAVAELKAFIDYVGILGKTVPPQDQVIQMFDAAAKWTVMRTATRAWGVYTANEEGIAWTGVRAMMARLKPAFQLAVQGDATLATRYPKLVAVLGAKKAIAKKGATTRVANKKQKAAGQPATHGAAAKKAMKVEKVVAGAVAHSHSGAPAAVAPVVATPPPGGTVKSEPVAPSNGGANGAAHA